MLFKIGVLKISGNSTGKHMCWSLLLINFNLKQTPTQFFSCEIWETFTNTFLTELLLWWLLLYSVTTLLILAMRILILMLEDSMWLQRIYFLTAI